MNHLLLVDGSGYIFRAYHALPPLTRKKDGLPIGAVSGFCNMLWKLLCEARNRTNDVVPTHFAVIFDHSSETFRKKIYPQYKANRSAPPDDLIPQFDLIRQAARAFNVPAIEVPGYEADDIIATYARMAEEQDFSITIISSDKDLMQLVTHRTTLYDGMKDRHIGIDDVVGKWGVRPEKMVDLQAMSGDATDNIPGIPGIGPKTAAALLAEFETLDNLLENAASIRQQKRRETIIAHADQALLSRQLVRLHDQVPLELDLDALLLEPQDGPMLIAFLKAMDLNSLTRRVATITGCDAGVIDAAFIDIAWEGGSQATSPAAIEKQDLFDVTSSISRKTSDTLPFLSPADFVETRQSQVLALPIDRSTYETIYDEEILISWLDAAKQQGFFAFDIETTSLDAMVAQLVGFSLALAPGKAAYVPLAHVSDAGGGLLSSRIETQIDFARALGLLKPILENEAILKIGQNIKYDWLVMHRYGIDIAGFDDTMLISYVLDSGRGFHGMDALSQQHLRHRPLSYKDVAGGGKTAISFAAVDIKQASEYAAEDADVTLRLWQILRPRLVAERLSRVYYRYEQPLVDVLCRMESRGILVDRQILARLSGEFSQKLALLEKEIHILAGERFNLASPRQLGDILFGKMNLPGGKKTKTGQWSTSAQILEDLAEAGHELARKIVDWRQIAKLKSTYSDALPNFINAATGRVHTNYSLAATTTGRLASSEPNLQNIPVRTWEGRQIRTAFIAPPGSLLLSADYSQIELRILAHVANIAALQRAFAQGVDIHALTASEMFGMPIKDMPAEVRRRAKAINFGIIYGISAFGLATQLGISREEAAHYIKTYFERFPGIHDYMEQTKEFARDHGYVETIFGRRIHYPDIRSSNPHIRAFNERAAINAPIQGAAADIIRRAMIRMEEALSQAGLGAKMLLQVHDELIFEVKEDEVQATSALVRDVMSEAAMPALALRVPLQVDINAAQNWDEAH